MSRTATRSPHLDFHTAPGYEMMWVAHERGVRPRQHHARRQVRRRRRRVVADRRRTGCSTRSSSRRTSSSTTARRSDAAAVKFSIDRIDGPSHQESGMRTVLRRRCTAVEAVDPPHRADPARSTPTRSCSTCSRGTARARCIYSPTATQKFTVEDRKQGKPGAVVRLRALQARRVGEGQPSRDGPVRQVLRAGLPYLDRIIIRVIKDPVTEMAAFKAGGDRLHRFVLARARRHDEGAEPEGSAS